MSEEKKNVQEEQDSSVGTVGKKEEDFFPKTDEESEDVPASSGTEEDATSEEDDGNKEQEPLEEGSEEGEEDNEDIGLNDENLKLEDFETEENKEEKKSGVQKRIDKLVAEKKALAERLDKIEKQSTEQTPEYSETLLRQAMAKAMEENNPNLMWEVMDYRVKKEKKAALADQEKKQQEIIKKQQRAAQEWHSTVEEYEYLSDKEEPEIYKGSHKDLNIKDQNSLLVQLAGKLYRDENKAERYQKDGGQRLAISDAIRIILRKKKTKASSKENEKLKRKLAKEKRKSSVSSGKSMNKEKLPATSGNSLEDYLKERKSTQAKARGEI
jgi:hypothetical protein